MQRTLKCFCCAAFPTLSTHRSVSSLICWRFLLCMVGLLIQTWSRLLKPSAHSVITSSLKELLKIKIPRTKLLLLRVSFSSSVLWSCALTDVMFILLHLEWSTLCPKKVVHQAWSITLSTFNRFSEFFHWQTLWEICDKTVIKDPTKPKFVATLPCEI